MGSSLRQDDQGEDVDDDDEEEGDVVDDDVDEGGDEDGDKDGGEDGDGGEDAGEDGDDDGDADDGARTYIMLMLCGDGDEGQGARHLSARAPSRSFSLIESTHASIPRMNKYASGERDARLAAYAHAMQAVLEAGEVADGGDRPSTLAKGAAATLSHFSGVCIGAILGGRRALCRLAVLRLFGTSLGWLAAGLWLT